jgi:penicillin-binding protein 2
MALFKTEARIQIVGFLFLLGLSAVLGKLWWVQVARGDYYTQKIRGQSEVTVRIPSVRGEILDRNGVKLVTNRASFSVDFYLNDMVKGYAQAFGRSKVPKIPYPHTVRGVYKETDEPDVVQIVRETVLPRLEQLGIHEDFNAKQLQTHYRNDTLVPFTYMEDIDFADMAKLSERDLGLPGVDLPIRPVRQYPYGALAAHVLGYVGQADTDPDDAKKFTYYQPDVEGKNNVEQAMDRWLRGEPGARVVKKNAKGVIEGDIGVRPPVPGDNVYLTIDARIQTIAEDALRIVGRGAAIVVNPNNGDILAMASVPSFDPNEFVPSVSSDDWNKLIKDDTNPLTNRAILSYAPGSTFKTVTALSGLLAGKGNNRYTCTGGVQYGNKYMKCWIAALGGQHGNLDLTDAIKFSCNAFFYQYGNATGIDMIDKVGTILGLGQKTGIELTNEAPGVLPGKEWLAENNPREHWSDGLTANTSIGQGDVKASPLQMSLIASTLANGGTCYYPRLIDRVVDHNGDDVIDPDTGKPVAQPPRVRVNLLDMGFKEDQIEKVRRGMWKVVNDAQGTAPKARLKDVEVAGKTGTAQFWRNGIKDNHTWFICFAPYQKPKYAVCVFLQGAKSGGGTAAPIAARIMEETLALDQGTFHVDVKPMTPAKGSFTFINAVDYSKPIPLEIAADASKMTGDEEAPTSEPDPADKNSDHDRIQVARPKVRAAPDAGGTVQPPPPGAAGNESPLMRSLRRFFRRSSDTDNPADSQQDLGAQQRNLRKQQKAQIRQQQSPTNQPQPQETPKRKKVLGIF